MDSQFTEINRLKAELADCRQCFDTIAAKLDASTKACALLASHRDRLAEAASLALEKLDTTGEYPGMYDKRSLQT